MLILLAGAVGGIFYAAREGLRRFVWENPEYLLKTIEVKNEGGSLQREEIIGMTGLKEGVNIFTVNISKVRETLVQVPQIETAEVERVMPDKIIILISERQPIAWVAEKRDEDPTAVQAGSFLMDARGVLFKSKQQRPEYFHLPVIFGVQTSGLEAGQVLQLPEIRAALDLIRLNCSDSAMQTRFQATGIDVSNGYCLVVTDRNHAQITFALDHIDVQLDTLLRLLDNIEQSKRELQTVNLMVQRNIPVTFVSNDRTASDPDESTPDDAKADDAKPAKPDAKSTPAKKTQSVGQKKALTVKKAHAANDNPDQARAIKKAIPVNSSDTKSNGQ